MGTGSVLMVMPQAFNRGWMGATHRLFHLSRAFESLGYEVVLLAGKAVDPHVQDSVDQAFPGQVIRTAHSGDYPPLMDRSATSRRAVRAGWRARGNHYYWSRVSWGWADRLDLCWLRAVLDRLGIRPTLLWGVSAGLLDGAVGARRVADCLDVAHVLELQDPPRGAGLEQDNPLTLAQFRLELQAASAIVVTTAIYREHLLQHFGLQPRRLHTVHLSFEPAPAAGSGPCPFPGPGPEELQPVEADLAAGWVFRVGYAGSLYAGQSLLPVVRAFARALEVEPWMRENARLQLAGGGAGVREALNCARSLGIGPQVDFYGPLSGPSVQAFLAPLQVLTVVLEQQRFRQVPGKVYESLATGKPILGAMPVDCEAAWILRKSGLGLVHEPEDVQGMTETLRALWQQWCGGRMPTRPDHGFIQGFSTRQLPHKLRAVLRGLADSGPAPESAPDPAPDACKVPRTINE